LNHSIAREVAEAVERVASLVLAEKKRLSTQPVESFTRRKIDGSPVTTVDLLAHTELIRELKAISEPYSDLPIVSEEDTEIPDPSRFQSHSIELARPYFWLIDPLDGTRDFIGGEETYAVVVALMRMGKDGMRPCFGVISAPEFDSGTTWWGGPELGVHVKRGAGRLSVSSEVKVRPPTPEKLRVLGSRSKPSARLLKLYDLIGATEITRLGSALKYALIAEGRSDLYPRFGPTSEWDTAAGHALLLAMGGDLIDLRTQKSLSYGKPGWTNSGCLAVGDVRLLHDDTVAEALLSMSVLAGNGNGT